MRSYSMRPDEKTNANEKKRKARKKNIILTESLCEWIVMLYNV